jgi:hypothetical protein
VKEAKYQFLGRWMGDELAIAKRKQAINSLLIQFRRRQGGEADVFGSRGSAYSLGEFLLPAWLRNEMIYF